MFVRDIGKGVERQSRFWAGIYSVYRTGELESNL